MLAWLKRVLRIGRGEARGLIVGPRGDALPTPTTQIVMGGPSLPVTKIHTLPNEISVADLPAGPCFAVRFGEQLAEEPITEDPSELPLLTHLRLAFRVTAGADRVSPEIVDRDDNWFDGEFRRYECLVQPTKENC